MVYASPCRRPCDHRRAGGALLGRSEQRRDTEQTGPKRFALDEEVQSVVLGAALGWPHAQRRHVVGGVGAHALPRQLYCLSRESTFPEDTYTTSSWPAAMRTIAAPNQIPTIQMGSLPDLHLRNVSTHHGQRQANSAAD